jgi:hypothetical protein
MSTLQLPRMLLWAALTVVFMTAALVAQQTLPGTLVAVTAYKAHLLSLGGWGGYWLDRALFPYDRPHTHLTEVINLDEAWTPDEGAGQLCMPTYSFSLAMLRRAIVVAACLLCVGLGA